MAPTKGKRSRIRSHVQKTSSTASNPIRHTHPRAQSHFANTKKDKRTIKHSALLSRIEKSKPPPKKSRRSSKKLITDLESLAEALPAVDEAEQVETATAIFRHRSLKSKPGAMKKKEKIMKMEKDRFNQNLAQMALWQGSNKDHGDDAGRHSLTGASSPADTKWAAIRSFIQQTMEKRPPHAPET
ncbi:MAG: hypothetical protein Q9219_005135 [cf. Caloplaca sp. 3 TL-2023]